MSNTCSRVFFNLYSRCISEVARKIATRSTLHSIASLMSCSFALTWARTSAFKPCSAIDFTATLTPFDTLGQPASIMCTPNSSRSCAIFILSSNLKKTFGVCSPSLRVVSNSRTLSEILKSGLNCNSKKFLFFK